MAIGSRSDTTGGCMEIATGIKKGSLRKRRPTLVFSPNSTRTLLTHTCSLFMPPLASVSTLPSLPLLDSNA